MTRDYQMKKRAVAHDETRERIIRATMAVHDEQGVAATSFVDVAKRAGLGAATVYRHFPTLGELVMACGSHVWAEMQPPVPAEAPAAFAGVDGREARLLRLVELLDGFYRRGALRLGKAAIDRDAVPELDGFLLAVEAGTAALVREAVKDETIAAPELQMLLVLTDFPVWRALQRLELDAPSRNRRFARLLSSIIAGGADREV